MPTALDDRWRERFGVTNELQAQMLIDSFHEYSSDDVVPDEWLRD